MLIDLEGVRRRNRSNSARAKAPPYSLPPLLATVSSDELFHKLQLRRTADGLDRCYLHGDPLVDAWELEHVEPLALGGLHQLDNLEAACPRCNRCKGALRLEQFLEEPHYQEVKKRLGSDVDPSISFRGRTTAALWAADDGKGDLARMLASRPLPMGHEAIAKVTDPSGRAACSRTMAALLQQSDPYRAMTLSQLQVATGYANDGALRREWEGLMGINTGTLKSRRLRPHPYLVPVRIPGKSPLFPEMAFRLRFRTIVQGSELQWSIAGVQELTPPDVDESE